MTETKFDEKVERINEIMEKNELCALDDYYTDMYMTKNHDFLFRVKHQRFYESQKEADEVLNEILNQLLKFDGSAVS